MTFGAIEWGAVVVMSVLVPFIVGLWIVNETMLFPDDSIGRIVCRLLMIGGVAGSFMLIVKAVKIVF